MFLDDCERLYKVENYEYEDQRKDEEIKKQEQEFVDILKQYMGYKRNLYKPFYEDKEEDSHSKRIQEILVENQCLDVRLVYIEKYVDDATKNIYFFKIIFLGKMYMLKIFKQGFLPRESMRGKKIQKDIEVKLKIIKEIQIDSLKYSLTSYFLNLQQPYTFFFYETLSDMWVNQDNACQIQQQMEQVGCEQAEIIDLNNTDIISGENNYLFKCRYENEFLIIKAIQRTYLQVDGAYNRQSNLYMKQLLLKKDLKEYILDIIENHPLQKKLDSDEYIFIFYEYYICSVADFFFYINNHQSIFAQNQQQIPSLIIGRIVIEISKILRMIKQFSVQIPQFYLHNIFLTYHPSTLEGQSVIQVKLGNISSISAAQDPIDLKKQMKFIIKQMIYFRKGTRQFEQSLVNPQDVIDFFSESNIEKCITQDDFKQKQLEDYLNLIIDSQTQYYQNNKFNVSKGSKQSIVHQIKGEFLYNSPSVIESDQGDDSSQINYQDEDEYSHIEDNNIEDSNIIEEQKVNYDNFYNNQNDTYQPELNHYQSTYNTSEKRYQLKNSFNFQYQRILRQLFQWNYQEIYQNSLNLKLQQAYETTQEFKNISNILNREGYKEVKFVKQGSNSRHFTCLNSDNQSQYVKVYNKLRQHKLTELFFKNQNDAQQIINWSSDVKILNQMQIQQQNNISTNIISMGSIDQYSNFGDYSNNIMLKPSKELIKGIYTFFIYKKCLCNLRDLVPYLQPGFIQFQDSPNLVYNMQNLYQEIAIQIVYILQCIHQANLVYLDLDLTKLLVDTNGTLRISNFQLCSKIRDINIDLLKCLNPIYQKELSTFFQIDEVFLLEQIRKGEYDQKIINSESFVLGVALTELFFSLDYRRFTEKLLNSSRQSLNTILHNSHEILKLKCMMPSSSIIFNSANNIQQSPVSLQETSLIDSTLILNEKQKKLAQISKDLFQAAKNKERKNIFSEILTQLENL